MSARNTTGLRRGALWAAAALACLAASLGASPAAAAVPANFQETTVFSGLTEPTAVQFAADGRVFVAEKSGRIKVFDNLADATPTMFADLNANVYNFWDRGLLGLALHPNFPATPYVYALYTYDAAPGGLAPRWGTPGVLSDPCPTPPGATADGCIVSGRLVRLEASGNTMTGPEVALIEDWCQQYPSHSIGAIAFGSDGALYVSGGDGASFNFTDWGQDGTPVNPCGDPPGTPGTALTPPTAEGGALRSQDIRTSGDPTSLDGTVLRIDPITGFGMPDNPNAFSPDPNLRRIVANGLRNPFRLTVKPGTSDVWVGDVGWNTWEEVNRLGPANDAVVDNFGWPCYEGNGRQSGYDSANLNICETLYAAGASAVKAPHYTWSHSEKVVAGETCPSGGSSAAGMAFYDGGNYPASYLGALFFSDYSRSCIWVMFPGAGGVPDPATRQTFVAGAAGPVDVKTGPNGDVFYVDFNGGTIRRVRYLGSNQAPVAVAQATPTTGATPLTVAFDARGSTDPESQALTYTWDLNGDGAYDDSTAAQPSFTYTTPGQVTVRLRATDPGGASDTDAIVITPSGSTAPVPTIATPAVGTVFTVGDTISFTGSATDAEDGPLAASRLTWSIVQHHCPSSCHQHPVQNFVGVSSGSFVAPDHEYPSHIELRLTATDSSGMQATASLQLNPRTVNLTIDSVPSGMQAVLGAESATTPFTRTVMVGSNNSVSAPTPQALGGRSYAFSTWSDGGAQSHNLTAPAAAATYTATYTDIGPAPVSGLVVAMGFEEGSGTTAVDRSGHANTGAITGATWTSGGKYGSALSFDGVNDLVTLADSNSLDVSNAMTLEAWVNPVVSTAWRTVLFKEQATNMVYALYGNRSGTNLPITEAWIGGKARTASGGTPIPLNTWTHLAATYDSSILRLYVNGVQVATFGIAGSILASTGPLRIGGNSIWAEWFNGLIDEVRVYDRALTPAEIATDMNTPIQPPAPPDTEPPTAPATLTATGGLGSVALTWSSATDNVGVAGYDVHRSQFPNPNFAVSDANRIAQVTGTSYTDTGRPAGTYYYRVVARDAANNYSVQSVSASGTATADTTSPTVSVTAPAEAATVSGAAVSVRASAADDVSVAGVQFRLDGVNLGLEDTAAPYEVVWDTFTASNGAHALTAVARDPSGNSTTATTVNVTVSNTAPPPPAGLVLGLGFDEGAGTSSLDSSGNGNHATISGASWTTAGRFGQALSFDGVNDIVTVADANSLDLSTGMTLEAWVRPSVLTSWRTVIFKEQPANIAYGIYGNRSTSNIPLAEASIGGTVRAANGTAQLALNAWSHVAATYDGNALRFYLNGALISTSLHVGSITASTSPLRIGGNTIWPEWWNGLIDEIRVYNRALTAAELTTDMNRSVGIPDTELPGAPGTLSATGSIGQATLTWGAASDNVGIKHYNVHRSTTVGFTPSDANRIAQPTTPGYVDGGLSAGTYYYRVVPEDLSGNKGPASNEASATATADTTAPTVALTAPAAGATVFNTIELAANASDNVAVVGVQFKVDGANVGTEDTSAPYTFSWNTRTVTNASHSITAVARDASNNSTESAARSVTVDNSAAPPPGLVAGYGFDEGTGTNVLDSSGNGNAGTTAGGPVWAPGRYGQSLLFDGVDDIVNVADSASLDLTSGMTLEAWINPSALGTAWRTVIFKERASNLVYSLYANRNTSVPTGEVSIGTTVQGTVGTTQLPLNTWTHLASTYDGTNLRLYVDGVQVGIRAVSGLMVASTGALRIGANAIWGERFQGRIDEVRIYNRALSDVELQSDMAARVAADTVAPTVTSVAPAAGAIDVAVGAPVTASFSEAMNAATITTSTFVLRNGAGTVMPATVSYDAGTSTATLTPTGALAYATTFTATVEGGAGTSVRDQAGNALATDRVWTFTTEAPPPPVLVITSTGNRFGDYAAEILRAEGLNAFVTADVSLLNASFLANFAVAVLGETPLSAAQVTTLSNWVTGGGNLVAMRPDKQLAGLLGLTDAAATVSEGYMKVDTTTAAGAGIVGDTIQFHGTADRYGLTAGATAIATLYSSSTASTGSPAVSHRGVGFSGGEAAAFTYDLARSVVYTRQGNPAWAGQDRDGINPIRPNDLFFGAFASSPQPDWLDVSKIGIPQADEQQRLLVNLIFRMTADTMPLPRLWYLPRGEKAAVVMTGDDHAVGGTAGRFDQYKAASPAGCSLATWDCVRGTSYIYPNSPLTDAQAAGYVADGFEVAVHVNASGGPCGNWTPATLDREFRDWRADFAAKYVSVPPSVTERTHCVAWSDYVTHAKVDLTYGVRLDTNYYHYPGPWIGNSPGYMTGSGLIQRFGDLDGTPIDVFQAHTHMNDEAAQPYPLTVNFLLDKALGPEGYYGIFTANMHTDQVASAGSDAIVASALARSVPVITAKQALDWVDGRDRTRMRGFTFAGGVLGFTLTAGPNTAGMEALLPRQSSAGTLSALRRDGSTVAFTIETVKGIQYVRFPVATGVFQATYS